MLIDGIALSEGSTLQNMTIASGTSFPQDGSVGELFYRTDEPNKGLYLNDGTVWANMSAVALAAAATKLATLRNIILTGDVAGTASFDGTADASIAVTLKGDVVSTKTFTGAVTCHYATEGSYVAANVTGATTLTLSGVPDSSKAYGMTFELTNAGTNITWPASVTWLGTAPVLRASGISMVTLVTRNGGTTWLGSAA